MNRFNAEGMPLQSSMSFKIQSLRDLFVARTMVEKLVYLLDDRRGFGIDDGAADYSCSLVTFLALQDFSV